LSNVAAASTASHKSQPETLPYWFSGLGRRPGGGKVMYFSRMSGVAAGFVEAGEFVVEGCVEVEEVHVGVDEGLDWD